MKNFVLGLLLAGVLSAAAEEPLLRFGVLSDTHVTKSSRSFSRVKQALALFKERGCDLVVHCGDIAESHDPAAYAAYRQVFDEAFAGGPKPREIYTYAWHDAFSYKGHAREKAYEDGPAPLEDIRRILKAENGHTDTVTVKDFAFVVFPQFVTGKGFLGWDEYEKRVADACAAHPGKPVFVIDHIPAGGVWGQSDASRTRILSKFPQVVYFCGHAHGTVRSELLIRQQGFTAVNAGCLYKWSAGTVGNPGPRRMSHEVLTTEVYADRILLRRWDIRDRSEIHPESPWLVPLPFEAASAPWTRERRRTQAPVPAFAADAAVTVRSEGSPFTGFALTFPSVGESACKYRIDIERKDAAGRWESYLWREELGDWWQAPKDRTATLTAQFGASCFTSGETVRFAVVPQNAYGVKGTTVIRSEPVTVPATGEKAEIVLKSSDPAAEFGIRPRKDKAGKRRLKPDADGWYGPFGGGEWVLALPAGLFSGGEGTRYRVVFDLETDQPETGARWNLRLANADGPGFASERLKTPAGKSGRMRYVLELSKKRPGERGASDSYDIYFENGSTGRLRPGAVRVERLLK